MKVEQPIAIAVDGDGDGWVLTEDGNKLTNLSPMVQIDFAISIH